MRVNIGRIDTFSTYLGQSWPESSVMCIEERREAWHLLSMRKNAGTFGAVLLLAGLAACESVPAPGSGPTTEAACPDCTPSADDSPGVFDALPLVCADCPARAGGETSDFDGSESSCTGSVAQPLTDEITRAYPWVDMRDRASGPFQAPLRFGQWSSNSTSEPPSGYDEVTTIIGSVSLGDPVFMQSTLAPESVGNPLLEGFTCSGGWVEFPASVSFHTADGALTATSIQGKLKVGQGALFSDLSASIDLNQVRGRLDLHLDPDPTVMPVLPSGEPSGAWLALELRVFPEGLRGRVSLRGVAAPSGLFPDDGCDENHVAIEPDAAQPWLDGNSFEEVFADWQPRLQSSQTYPARWIRGSQVDVSIGPAAPSHVCMGADGLRQRPEFSLETSTRLSSSDGRVDITLPYASLREGQAVQSLTPLSGSSQDVWIPAAEFEERTGIRGVDPASDLYLRAWGSVVYSLAEPSRPFLGNIVIDGTACSPTMRELPDGGPCVSRTRDCLSWPPSESNCP
jgi:hypothetical protein